MFANAATRASTEGHQDQIHQLLDFLVFRLPSFRLEFVCFFKQSFIVKRSRLEIVQGRACFHRHISNQSINSSQSIKNSLGWTVHPQNFQLDPVDKLKLFQILKGKARIILKIVIYLLPHILLKLRELKYPEKTHREKRGCGIRTSCGKSHNLLDYFFVCVV